MEIVKVDDNGDEVVKETTFRRELLTRCEKEFEKDKRDDETKEEMLKAIEEAAPVRVILIITIFSSDWTDISNESVK